MFVSLSLMCGIIGILTDNLLIKKIEDCLLNLEYRGYDSAGVAVIQKKEIEIVKSVGLINNLIHKLKFHNFENALVGIGHTRWATHGEVNEINAHPICDGNVAVVHNGIIENAQEIKNYLEKRNVNFITETDTEVITRSISWNLKNGKTFFDAVNETVKILSGTFAFCAILRNDENSLIAAKRSSPLVLGELIGKTGFIISSDINAVAKYIDSSIDFDDDEILVLERKKSAFNNIFMKNNKEVKKVWKRNVLKEVKITHEPYDSFMMKEIHDQILIIKNFSESFEKLNLKKNSFEELQNLNKRNQEIENNINSNLESNSKENLLKKSEFNHILKNLNGINGVCIIGCGSSLYAGHLAKHWIERIVKIPVTVECASEFIYRKPFIFDDYIYVFVSQSGETIEVIKCMELIKSLGKRILLLTNRAHSKMYKMSDEVMLLNAGDEMSVASTKAFTAQLCSFISLILNFLISKFNLEDVNFLLEKFSKLAEAVECLIKNKEIYFTVAEKICEYNHVIFTGRGMLFPIALEAALKLKEISYIHAEGISAGELKHGPIALISDDFIVVSFLIDNDLFEKSISNVHEIISRGGFVYIITDENGKEKIIEKKLNKNLYELCVVPNVDPIFSPFLMLISGQLIAYNAAKIKGRNIDRPRNLAKSITVE